MALITVQVDTWHSLRPEKYKRGNGHDNYVAYGDYYLLNTNRMVEIKETGFAEIVFKYAQNPNDHRCSLDTINATAVLSQVIGTHDGAPTSKFATLSIFPGFDTTETPVDTLVEWDDICMIYQTPRDYEDDVAHCVYYKESYKRTLCMINMTLSDVVTQQGILL